MENYFDGEDLIFLHEKLDSFATHHQNKGGQIAHRLIKSELIDNVKSMPRDGSSEALIRQDGYDLALMQVLSLLRDRFVP